MKTLFALLCLTGTLTWPAAAEPPAEPQKDARQLLQEGLFEEEASRNLDKAAAAYAEVIAKFDAQRTMAATAIFRLAEVKAKLGKKDEAAALWQRLVTEFPNHDPLAKLSRERLAGIGAKEPGPAAASDSPDGGEEAAEIARLRIIARNSPDLLFAPGDQNRTPLDLAVSKGWLKATEYLLSQGAKIEDTKSPYSVLALAAAQGHKAMVEFLLAHGADINAMGYIAAVQSHATALAAAVQFDRKAILTLLLDRGADVNKPDSNGKSPLLLACEKGDPETCRALLAKGADPNAAPPLSKDQNSQDPVLGGKRTPRTPLLQGVNAGRWNADLCRLLLEHGAKPLVPEKDRGSEIEAAISSGNAEALALLLPKLPKLTDADTLRLAILTANPEILKLVLQHHADINVKSETEQPILSQAIHRNWFEAIPILLEAGASPKATDNRKMTPLHFLAGSPLYGREAPQPLRVWNPQPPQQFLPRQNQVRPPMVPGQPVPNTQRPAMRTHVFAFPYAAMPRQTMQVEQTIRSMNEEWEKRRPYFEALVAKGADVNARDTDDCTPFFAFMTVNTWSTDAVAWFVAKGADLSARGKPPGYDAPLTPLEVSMPDMRQEHARRFLFPKVAKPGVILLWGDGQPLDEPREFKRKGDADAPPALADIVAEMTKPGPPQFNVTHVSIVINRKGADGAWKEAACVRVPLEKDAKLPEFPRLEWGDLVYFSPMDDRQTAAGDATAPGEGSVPAPVPAGAGGRPRTRTINQ
jgi:ankyrin repeat protein